jgi:sugar-phosphatase
MDADEVERFAHGRPSRDTIRSLVPDADQEREAAALEDAELHDTDGVTSLPGARGLLESDLRVAIVTSCSTALAMTRLRAAGLPVPAVLVSSDGLEHGKPDPTCFLVGAQRLGADPARCVVLEDAPAGVRAGRDAGARVIAVRTTHADEDLSEADAIVDDLSSLLSAASAA